MKRPSTSKPPRRDDVVTRRTQEQPGRDDVHEQRVPDQASEGALERQSESSRLKRPPSVDEAGGR